SVQDSEIVCLAPFEISQSTQITVELGGNRSNSVRMRVVSSDPQILSILNADGTPNSADNPAQPGSLLTIYASGLGRTVPPGVDGAVNNSTPLFGPAFGFSFQGNPVAPQFIGAAAGMAAGIVQFNVTVPTPLAASNSASNQVW